MKLSCLPVSLYPKLASGWLTLADWFQMAAQLGLDGADLSVSHVTSRAPAYLSELRRAASDSGVQLAILATYSDFTHPDAHYRKRQTDDARAWIAAAHCMGVGFLRLTAGQAHPDVPEDAGVCWAVEGLTACAEDAAAAGVRVLFENHTRGSVWEYNDFAHPAVRFLQVARQTATSGVEVLFDTANCCARNDDPFAVLEAVISRLGAIHLSDIRRCGAFEPTTIGTGAAPIRGLLQRIVDSGFDGWISIEEASRTGDEGLQRAVAFADRAWVEAGGRPRRAR